MWAVSTKNQVKLEIERARENSNVTREAEMTLFLLCSPQNLTQCLAHHRSSINVC